MWYPWPTGLFYKKNFLKNRTFQAKVGTHLSDRYEQQEGVPQGSVLSCTLFALAINDITSVLPHDVQGILYVDNLAENNQQYNPMDTKPLL